jgi:hypothetical protein
MDRLAARDEVPFGDSWSINTPFLAPGDLILKRLRLKWKDFVTNFLLLGITFVTIETLSYFFFPGRYAWLLPEYRWHFSSESVPDVARGYPQHYFRKDPILGFDIREYSIGLHGISDGIRYRVFSNSLGCFDHNESDSFSGRDYVYFAGDSFMWGYTRYENKLATQFEKITKIPSAKCGVPHTGTKHQFGKFRSVAARIGHFPTTVFVGFHDNDLSNDYVHPHTTVIEGWQVDTVYLDEPRTLKLYRPSPLKLEEAVAKFVESNAISRNQESHSYWYLLKTRLKEYSFTANILNAWRRKISPGVGQQQGDIRNKFGYSFYYLAEPGAPEPHNNPHFLPYRTSALAAPNRQAFIEWKAHADNNKYKLVVVIIPPNFYFSDINRYAELRDFFTLNNIQYIDLTLEFNRSKSAMSTLYWAQDEHLNDGGNRAIGSMIASKYVEPSQ